MEELLRSLRARVSLVRLALDTTRGQTDWLVKTVNEHVDLRVQDGHWLTTNLLGVLCLAIIWDVKTRHIEYGAALLEEMARTPDWQESPLATAVIAAMLGDAPKIAFFGRSTEDGVRHIHCNHAPCGASWTHDLQSVLRPVWHRLRQELAELPPMTPVSANAFQRRESSITASERRILALLRESSRNGRVVITAHNGEVNCEVWEGNRGCQHNFALETEVTP